MLRVWVECRHDPIALVSSLSRRLKQQTTMFNEQETGDLLSRHCLCSKNSDIVATLETCAWKSDH